MLAWDCGGGGGFCTFAVLPPHPASNEIIAAAKRKRIHRLVATADLLRTELRHLDFHRIRFRTQMPTHTQNRVPGRRRVKSKPTQRSEAPHSSCSPPSLHGRRK